MGCSNSKELVKDVHTLLENVRPEDYKTLEYTLVRGWEVYNQLNRKDKGKVKNLTQVYMAQ